MASAQGINQRLRQKKDCPFVFHIKGQQIKDLRYSWKKACKIIDIEGKIFHDLRRAGLRNMVRQEFRNRWL